MSWGPDAQNPTPDWTMSVSLESVPRGSEHLTEVTSLREALLAWRALDSAAQDDATLILERPIIVEGAQLNRFEGQGIKVLADRLPA